jgi:NIPSNAP
MTALPAARRGTLLHRAAGLIALAATAALAACSSLSMSQKHEPKGPAIGLYELRVYTAAEGKMDALDARFRDHTIDLFKRHGMTPIAFFHTVVAQGAPADNRLFYIMGYKDRETRDKAWTAFADDPDWKAVYAASQANGSLTTRIENTFLTATDYSPPLNTKSAASPRLFELRTYTATPGKLENVHARFRDHTLTIFARHAMSSMIYWRPVNDQPAMENKLVYLLSFPNVEARNQAWTDFSADPEWKKVSADSNKDGPILITPGGVVSVQLSPTDYSPLK